MSSHRIRSSGRSACAVVVLLMSHWLPGCMLQAVDSVVTSGNANIISESNLSATPSSGASAAADAVDVLATLSVEVSPTAEDPRERFRRSVTLLATSSDDVTTMLEAGAEVSSTPAPSAATNSTLSSAAVIRATPPTNRSETLSPNATSAKPPTQGSTTGNSSENMTTSPAPSTIQPICLTNDTVELRKGDARLHLRPPPRSPTCNCLQKVNVHPYAAGAIGAADADVASASHNASDNASSSSSSPPFNITLTDSIRGRVCVEFVCDNGSFFEPVDFGTDGAYQLRVALGKPANSSLHITWQTAPEPTSGKLSGTLEKGYAITLSKAGEDRPICNINLLVCAEESGNNLPSFKLTHNNGDITIDNWNCSSLGDLCSRTCSGDKSAYANVTCSFQVRGLKPWTNYSVHFANANISVLTNDTVPSEVRRINFVPQKNPDGTVDKTASLTWEQPDVVGDKTVYHLSLSGPHSSQARSSETRELMLRMRLDFDKRYVVTIKACSHSGCSESKELQYTHMPGKPKAKQAENKLAVDATSKSFQFIMANATDYFDAEAGDLKKFSVALGSGGSHQPSESELPLCSGMELGVVPACLLWTPEDASRLLFNARYMIGEDCEQDSNCRHAKLKPEHEYCLFFIGYTSSDESSNSSCFATAHTKPDMTGLVVLVVVLLLVLLVLAAALLLLILRRRKVLRFQLPWENAGRERHRNDLEMSRRRLTAMHVPLKEFGAHVRRMHENSNLEFSRQFKDIKQLSPAHPFETAIFPGNVAKNRYADIMPFDHSRVHLITNDDDEYDGADYINANYIPGFNSPREYIATQGPLPSTLSDFWRMVWEQNVPTVVMLTSLVERGCTKCERYWPDAAHLQNSSGEITSSDDDVPAGSVCYDDIRVKPVSYETYESYDLTVLELEMGSTKKRVNHFYYRLWPDMSCPHDKEVFVHFVEQVRQSHQPGRHAVGPMVVHCSAGVGRTGTFIVVDVLLQRIRVQSFIDIPSEVLSLREHRCRMVQTEDQYVFIHDCIAEAIDLLEAKSSTKPNNGLTVSGTQGDDLKQSPVQRSPATKSPAVRSPASRSPASRSPAATSSALASQLPASRSPAPEVRTVGAASQQQSPSATAAVERAAAAADERDGDDDEGETDDNDEEESDESSRSTPAEEGPLLGGGHSSGTGGRGGGGGSLEV